MLRRTYATMAKFLPPPPFPGSRRVMLYMDERRAYHQARRARRRTRGGAEEDRGSAEEDRGSAEGGAEGGTTRREANEVANKMKARGTSS